MNPVIPAGLLVLALLLTACATPSLPLAMTGEADSGAARDNAEGIAQYNLGHWNEARTHFEAAVAAAPQSAEAHYNLALTLHKLSLSLYNEATAHLIKAAQLAPSNTAITNSSVFRSHDRFVRDEGEGYGGAGFGVLPAIGVP